LAHENLRPAFGGVSANTLFKNSEMLAVRRDRLSRPNKGAVHEKEVCENGKRNIGDTYDSEGANDRLESTTHGAT
jgi:hypothetical protein